VSGRGSTSARLMTILQVRTGAAPRHAKPSRALCRCRVQCAAPRGPAPAGAHSGPGQSGEGGKVGAAPPASAGAGLTWLPSPDCPGRLCWVMGVGGLRGRGGAGGIWAGDARRGCAGFCRRLTVQGINTEWFERCGCGFCRWLTVQGICTEWFEREVEPGFVGGSRFKGSIRDGLNGAVVRSFAAGSRFKGSIRDGLNGATGLGLGAPCDGRMTGAHRPGAWAASSQPTGLSPA
jgi:hypothetical protein